MPKSVVASLTIVELSQDSVVCAGLLPAAVGSPHQLLRPTYLLSELPSASLAAIGNAVVQYNDGTIVHTAGPVGSASLTFQAEAVFEASQEPPFVSLASQVALASGPSLVSLGAAQAADQSV